MNHGIYECCFPKSMKNVLLSFIDYAKNCLIESMFCCQKTKEAIQTSDVFAPCWQKCASYYLADAISSLNTIKDQVLLICLILLRKLEKNTIK